MKHEFENPYQLISKEHDSIMDLLVQHNYLFITGNGGCGKSHLSFSNKTLAYY